MEIQHDLSHHATADHHEHHEMPTSGRALSAVALSATLHCLTGCAIGEVTGMVIGTAAGLSNFSTIVISVALAFLFGYSLTSLPLLRAGFALAAVVPIALASDTFSIALMEIVDNLIMVVIPGALHAGLDDILFWGSLLFSLAVAGAAAFPLNRWLIARGKGHAAVHKTGVHGGPPARVVGAIAAAAFVFGSAVLAAEAIDSSDSGGAMGGHGMGAEPAAVRGLSARAGAMTLKLEQSSLPLGKQAELSFRIADKDGEPVRDYDVEHEKRMHVIVARRDLTGFFHLHPKLDSSGAWRTEVKLPSGGQWRVFADFKHEGENFTLADDVAVAGSSAPRRLPAPSNSARTATGYDVELDAGSLSAGKETELAFSVTRDGQPVDVEPYLGADGHLVALRKGDLAYLHVHPVEAGGHGDGGHMSEGEGIRFATEFPSANTYRLFLQVKHEGRVHTAAFTRTVG
jgi:Domain of unknown function (DUF4396)